MPQGTRRSVLRKKRPHSAGFYGKALDEADRDDLWEAAQMEGLDDEVALLRLMLRRLLREHPDEVKLQLDTVDMIVKALHARYQLSNEQKNRLKDAMLKVLTEVAVPLGLKFLPRPK